MQCSQGPFKVGTLAMTRKSDTPILKCKAFNAMCVGEWLLSECLAQAAAHNDNEYMHVRAVTLWGISRFYQVLRDNGMWLGEGALQDLHCARNAMLHGYMFMATLAIRDQVPRWPLRPQLHMMDHAERVAQSLATNPASWWTFQY